MGKAVFISIIIIHGLIHLMGFAKSFGLLRITELSQDISKPLGLLWLLSAILFF
jgi:ssRNA-specific RNase YbeY (16S rRNA maturation enzyme)